MKKIRHDGLWLKDSSPEWLNKKEKSNENPNQKTHLPHCILQTNIKV